MKRDNASKTYNIPRNIVTLPESSELERAVLGALILEPGYLPDVMEIVDKTAFYVTTNASIFSVMQAMFADGCKIDLYTLSQRCKDTPGVEISLAYLAGLTQTVGSGANCIDHARQLKELDNRRRFIMLGYEIATRASIGANSTDDITEWITWQVDGIAANSASTNDLTPLSDAVHNTLQNIEQRQRALQAGECIGIPTGLERLDAVTGGWRGGQLIVLAGRPAMGKSAAMLHFARIAAAGVPVCIFSLEMPNSQLIGRMLVGGSGINPAMFRAGNIDGNGWTRLEQAGTELSAMPIYLNDRAGISMNAIRSQCKAMNRRRYCGMVIIDYLQLVDTTSGNRNQTREREIADASRAAKLLAKEIDAPVILLSQLSRKVEERADKTPLLSDLRESGAIEQDADIVIFIDRPAMYGVQSIETTRYGTIGTEGLGRFIIAKNREGETGAIYFRHNTSLTRFTDYEFSTENQVLNIK